MPFQTLNSVLSRPAIGRQPELTTATAPPAQTVHNLVAVLQAETRPPLWVYVDDPPAASPAGDVCTLEDLARWEVAAYDGPTLCFPAVDIVRPDLPTKGPRFRSLAAWLRAVAGQTCLNQTAYALAAYLLDYVENPRLNPELRQRALPQIIALALPSLLLDRPADGLVAVLPDPDLWRYLQEYSARCVYLDERLPAGRQTALSELQADGAHAGEDWLIALDEVQLFRPLTDPQRTRLIDLRSLLHEAGHAPALQATVGDLAHVCRRHAAQVPEAARAARLRQTAWSLMAERRLMDEETDDLVCLIPDPDFEVFAETGHGRRFYRILPEVTGPLQAVPIEALFTRVAVFSRGVAAAVALAPLEPYLRSRGVEDYLDLGHVLWRAGKSAQLARTLTLFARDLAEWTVGERHARLIQLELAAETAQRGCILAGLEAPTADGLGLYQRHLDAAYQTVIGVYRALADEFEPPYRDFFQGLAAWFECALLRASTQIEAQLRLVMRRVTAIRQLHFARDNTSPASQLLDIANASLSLFSGSGQPEFIQQYLSQITNRPGSRADYRRAAAGGDTPLPILSDFFLQHFQELAALVEELREAGQSTLHEDDKLQRLTQIQLRLEEAGRRFFALPHERRVLQALCAQAVEQAVQLARELRGSAVLECQLLTTEVQQHAASRLTLALRNVGRAPAEAVQVTLAGSERFNILNVTAAVEVGRLAPGARQTVGFELQPRVDDQLPLRFTLAYHDQQGDHAKTQDFLARVTSLDVGPFVRKRNPYISGNPIQDPRRFYGRRAEVLAVVDHLASEAAQNILLRGARRTGKTSVLNMLKAIVADEPNARTQFDIRPDWRPRLDQLRVAFLDLTALPGVGQSVTPGDFYAAVGAAAAQAVGLEPAPAGPLSRAAFQHELARCLAALPPGGRLVLLLDEFDVVETITEPDIYYHLRHVITYLQRITWVVASAAGLYQAVRDYASPLFNVFRIIELTRLDPDDARRLILDPLAGERVQFLDEAVDAVLEQTGCHPYFLQLLCREIIEHLNEKQTNYVLRSTVQAVVEKIVGRGRLAYDHFAYLWDHTDAFSRLILAQLLMAPEPLDRAELWSRLRAALRRKQRTQDEARLAEAFDRSLRWLQNVIEAIVPDTQHRYGLGLPLFRYWLNERGPRERLLADALEEAVQKAQEVTRG